ncbi:hypothetical protein MAPG_05575 [Magnaporthiopsis poae ATCC 64411]|uniref:Uncharacterized protein n=1 Tax=Magnaporthiopsis poae (strain ATCC 64411 / 73-15) TaxID=644358 RepID=A0A0C4DZR9_MAGP6|nr:hypothetical protein MAPG_05575 [Magnaporthiopsis poae ATCC 64411]
MAARLVEPVHKLQSAASDTPKYQAFDRHTSVHGVEVEFESGQPSPAVRLFPEKQGNTEPPSQESAALTPAPLIPCRNSRAHGGSGSAFPFGCTSSPEQARLAAAAVQLPASMTLGPIRLARLGAQEPGLWSAQLAVLLRKTAPLSIAIPPSAICYGRYSVSASPASPIPRCESLVSLPPHLPWLEWIEGRTRQALSVAET